jgi:hypothetical protein
MPRILPQSDAPHFAAIGSWYKPMGKLATVVHMHNVTVSVFQTDTAAIYRSAPV